MMTMTRPLEVGLVVTDLERSMSIYVDVFGCKEVHRSQVPANINGPAGLGGPTTVVWLQTPSGERLKLIFPAEEPTPATGITPITRSRGLGYLTFYVEDVEPIVEQLTARGAQPISDPVLVEARGKRISFWTDSEGVVLEIVDGHGAAN
jgi:catechol 2,3-dioxygenase-like lactoylglutathione lyase family enzyme